MPWPLEYHRAGQVVRLIIPDAVEVWAVMDYLAANFQRPNAAARVAGLPVRAKGKR